MNIQEYWHDIDSRLEQLLENGFVKLPSLKVFDLDFVASDISDEMGSLTFKELGSQHKNFLRDLSIDEYLTPRLHNIAKERFRYKGDVSNQYHIARKVEPGNAKEMYRAHFDSHLFTMVLPLKIPESAQDETAGDLIYFPNVRKVPTNEISNFFGKACFQSLHQAQTISLPNRLSIAVCNLRLKYFLLIFLEKLAIKDLLLKKE